MGGECTEMGDWETAVVADSERSVCVCISVRERKGTSGSRVCHYDLELWNAMAK